MSRMHVCLSLSKKEFWLTVKLLPAVHMVSITSELSNTHNENKEMYTVYIVHAFLKLVNRTSWKFEKHHLPPMSSSLQLYIKPLYTESDHWSNKTSTGYSDWQQFSRVSGDLESVKVT